MVMNLEKLMQVTGYILRKYRETKLNYTKLIKLMYLADRESIKETNVSITGDVYYSLNNGPILSGVYDLIKGRYSDYTAQKLWDEQFTKDEYNLNCVIDCMPDSKLSECEKDILDKIDAEYHDKTWKEMIEIVHNPRVCPEWQNPNGSRLPIEKRTILESLGRI
jgi:hypothetical protein